MRHKSKKQRNGKAGRIASGSAANAPPGRFAFRIFVPFVRLRGVCLSGGAQRRHLYQDKHTPRSQ